MRLRIEYFKCFVNTDIDLNRLTVFAGANSAGKSSSIQSILFLRQTIEMFGTLSGVNNYYDINIDKFLGNNVPLNGQFMLSLGNSNLVLSKYSDKFITIGLHDTGGEISIVYEADNENSQLWLKCVDIEENIINQNFPILKREFYYLNAERLGPRIHQNLEFLEYLNTGWQGERTAQIIDYNGGLYKIDKSRLFPETSNYFMNYQVEKWLNFILPGNRIKAITDTNMLSSQILIENTFTKSEPTASTNVGFGISYVLPIIVTGLIAKEGSYMIIENPEAHLHPAAQSKLGSFLSFIAENGVNIIIETHSDHIINGIQISAAKKEINNELITINYFKVEENSLEPEIIPIKISSKGELSEWPMGFFDQSQRDLVELFKRRKK